MMSRLNDDDAPGGCGRAEVEVGDYAGGPDAPEVSFDAALDALMHEVRPAPEWGATAVADHTRRVIALLAEQSPRDESLGNDVAEVAFRRLAAALKQFGHKPDKTAGYVRKLNEARRLGSAGSLERAGRDGRGQAVSYDAVPGGPDCPVDDPAEWGMYRVAEGSDRKLTNFCLFVDEHVRVVDGLDVGSRFDGRLVLDGVSRPFAISPADYASKDRLTAALYAVGGPGVQLDCSADEFRKAVAQVSDTRTTRLTTAFGWDEGKTSFLTPAGAVTAAGLVTAGPGDLRVDLSGAEKARYLRFNPLGAAELAGLKRHVPEDLLAVHDPVVTWTLFAASCLAVLLGHAGDSNRFALWLCGRTGVGKSSAAKLFVNFFGDFPVASARFQSWNSTANSIQREGYNFKDTLYLVDDYKPDTARQTDVVRILQANADGSARGRLRADGTPNPGREVRGLLVCTGEDLPEHSASALARSVVVQVPSFDLDRDRYERCVERSALYSGMTLDFVRYILAEGVAARFQEEVRREHRRLHGGIAGKPNAPRIAGNFALLAAAFRAGCEYLGDAWPGAADAAEQYTGTDLVALRDAAVRGSSEQGPGQVLLATLADLAENGRVHIDGYSNRDKLDPAARTIGKVCPTSTRRRALLLNLSLCIEAVNETLRRQSRPEVTATPQAIQSELRADGHLLGPDCLPLPAGEGGGASVQARIGGANLRCIRVSPEALFRPEHGAFPGER